MKCLVNDQRIGNGATISAVEIDGFVLIDGVSYNSIGIDASGQGNHFQDENFAVGNTDEVWSQSEVAGSSYYTGEGVDRLFDGSLSTWAAPGSNDPSKFFELDFTSLNLTYTKIELVLGASVGATGTVLLNNQDITTNITSPAVPPAVGKLYNATDWITGDKQLKTFKISNGGGSSNHVAYAIILDGKILGQEHPRHGARHPVKDYAVIGDSTVVSMAT